MKKNLKNISQFPQSKFGCRKGIKVASLNVNSLIPHIDEIEANIKEHGIHFLALNETKISSDILSENLEINGYKLGRKDRNRYGGVVAFYSKDTLRYNSRQDVPVSDLEMLCVEITLPNSKPYIILVRYRPPERKY